MEPKKEESFADEDQSDLKITQVEGKKKSQLSEAQQKRLQNYISENSWEGLDAVKAEVVSAAVNDLNWERPSKIQAVSIPVCVNTPYPNLIAQAKNGSGKTGAFAISLLQRVEADDECTQGAILCITRELAHQVFNILQKLGKNIEGLKVALLIPGVEPRDVEASKPHIIISTPDTLKKYAIKFKKSLNSLKCFVVDEADEVIQSENQFNALKTIMDKLPTDCQKLLFSATFNLDMNDFTEKYVPNAVSITKKNEELSLKQVKQLIIKAEDNFKLLAEIFNDVASTATIIFVNTRMHAVQLQKFLQEKGHPAYILMGREMSQEERDETFKRFSNKEFEVLITTNVLARGIDIRFVKCVINFDLPVKFDDREKADVSTYLHRIGRTGRFGDVGVAINIVKNEADQSTVDQLIAFYGENMQVVDDYSQLRSIIEQHLEGEGI
eukprot:CAMPEP_0115011022 /NCGR_PEP_ID=MMETSP0216-20121206/23721_1 /TAXON_ID=223996 /ORGANISM="Protocruzia adherens, Strain Boccale" /LENGTH=439 /DNA_ID=CAMNT_0002379463 /DNA_START=45 /DNA_END=1364 /DNA_ORIENTATION=+